MLNEIIVRFDPNTDQEKLKDKALSISVTKTLPLEKLNDVMVPLLKKTKTMQKIYHRIILPKRIIRKLVRIVKKSRLKT